MMKSALIKIEYLTDKKLDNQEYKPSLAHLSKLAGFERKKAMLGSNWD
jgi:hypothetical protein